MKNYTITVNGTVYDVVVEEGASGAPAAAKAPAAPKAAPKAAPAAAPKAAPARASRPRRSMIEVKSYFMEKAFLSLVFPIITGWAVGRKREIGQGWRLC